jgi:hypothetical protein
MKQRTLKDAHTYCVVHNVSSQRYGPILEKYIRTKFNYIKNVDYRFASISNAYPLKENYKTVRKDKP